LFYLLKIPRLRSGGQWQKQSYFDTDCPSPDGSGYPFVAAFDTKDNNVQPDQLLKNKKLLTGKWREILGLSVHACAW
jgi:hypothetical protein